MKILYLSAALLPSEISHSLSIMRMCQAFVDSGHDVVLTGRAVAGETRDPVACYGLRGGFRVVLNRVPALWDNPLGRRLLLPGLALAWKTRGLFDCFRPDLVYSRLTLLELALVPAGVPVLYEMHSLGPLRRSWIHRRAFHWLLRRNRLRRIVVTTQGLAALLREEIPQVEVVVARLSAEHPVAVGADDLAAFRAAQLQGRDFRFHVGYTGNLDTFGLRGTEIICQAASRMPEAAFHVVGGDAQTVAYWRREGAAHNIHGNLFFYGHRSPAEMPFFLGCFDVVLAPLQNKASAEAPSGMGMSPLKLAQYMSYGKAIVASDIPSHREVLAQGKTALLVTDRNVDAWVAAIRRLLDDPALARELGENAARAYAGEFTPEARVASVLAGLSAPEAAPRPERSCA